MAAKAIIAAEGHQKQSEIEAAAGTWEGDKLKVSKHAEKLHQVDDPPKVPPRGWKCSRCELASNLWLNLTDGTISCGRRFFDGSGGNNHAVDHYNETKYPLAVKLGTIAADGKADVFSYEEDDMVEDPHLAKHLEHFGINLTAMEKTDKSMVELEIDINQRASEWMTITESGKKLEPVFGPGLTGMENLGNTCYINSLVQVLFTLPGFKQQYVDRVEKAFDKVSFQDQSFLEDVEFQMCKLGLGLWSGDYSLKGEEEEDRRGVRPTLFKNLIGKGHAEFSTKQQQDAQEYFLHLLTVIERDNKRRGRTDHAFHSLQFEVEDRHECGTSKKVKYMTRVEDYLPLSIPMEMATNQSAVDDYKKKKQEVESRGERVKPEEVVRPRIPFSSCLEKFLEEETVDDFYSSAIKAKTFARKTMRLKTFPDHLFIQLKKFDVGQDWVPFKLDVEVEMPDEIDIRDLRTQGGLRDGEEVLPQEESGDGEPPVVPDPAIVQQLSEIFPAEGCKKAAFHTKNAGAEAAMNWILEHMNDPDFNEPFVTSSQPSKFEVNQEALENLMAMSFSKQKATKALKLTDNNVERAVDWIFSHPDDDGNEEDESKSQEKAKALTDGSSKYRLKAFISHMGNSHLVGHYVCHILKEDIGWVIFNDEKVSRSENPPKDLGYLYLYERIN